MSKNLTIPDEVVMNKIYLIRGQKVMLDRDLSELYLNPKTEPMRKVGFKRKEEKD